MRNKEVLLVKLTQRLRLAFANLEERPRTGLKLRFQLAFVSVLSVTL